MKAVKNYGIRLDYSSRLENDYDVWEIGFGNEHQWDVYLRASWLAQIHDLKSVIDLGTGNGGKLLHFFRKLDTVGIDVQYTVEMFLEKAYPDRDWTWSSKEIPNKDLLICADVIEHIPYPDVILSFIEKSAPKFVVLSTPDRDQLPAEYHVGPPRNKCHCREWSFAEFRYWIEMLLPGYEILEHIRVKPSDVTQMMVLRLL